MGMTSINFKMKQIEDQIIEKGDTKKVEQFYNLRQNKPKL